MAVCLVTVGSTKFEALTTHLDDNAVQFVKELKAKGINKLIMQIGKTKKLPQKLPKLADEKFQFECFEYTKKFKEILSTASLVISHAGAGSISETLGYRIPLIAVVNETLMDNHQEELAAAMSKDGYLYDAKVENVLETLRKADFKRLREYPKPKPKDFAVFLDEQVGF